jgi:lipid A 3-O-deacylase
MPQRLFYFLLVSALSLPLSTPAAVTGPWSFTFRMENDLPVNTDRYYTNGATFAFAHCTEERDVLWPLLLRLPGLNRPGLLATGFDFGQIMVTPADLTQVTPDPQDRPYAGLLFIGASWQRFADNHYSALKLITGVVGPASLAEQTQKLVHRSIGVALPQGWAQQLQNEPIINLVYERRWRSPLWGQLEGLGGDAITVGGAMVGNVLTQAYAQLQVRAGWRTPQDFGTSLIRGIGSLPPARDNAPWGAHFFAGIGTFAIARNLTLDGNSFQTSPHVGHYPFVPIAETGLVIRSRRWQVIVTWNTWGREFPAQPRRAEFATIAYTVFR